MLERVKGLRAALLIAMSAAILFSFLGNARLWDRDEPRNAQAAREMLERNDWVVPTFNGDLRSHKPVMLYWLQMASYQVFGQSDFTARLPSAALGVLCVLAIALLASRFAGEGTILGPAGFWTGAVLSTSLLFVMAGRAATPDSCLIAFTTMGIAALVGGLLVPDDRRSPLAKSVMRDKIPLLYAGLGYTALGLAILSKGPVGIILPMIVIHVWWLVNNAPERNKEGKNSWLRRLVRVQQVFHPRRIPAALSALRTIPGVLLSVLVAAPWYIAVGLETDGEFLADFFWRHNVERAVSSMEGHSGSVFFYPAALLVGTFPWSLWLLPILWWGTKAYRRGPANRALVSLAVTWVVVTVAAFTCAGTKLPSYITSCYPGAALLIGGFLKDFAADVRMPSKAWRTLAACVALVIAFCITTGLVIVSRVEGLPMVRWVGACGLALATAGIAGLIVDYQSRARLVPSIWLSAAVMLHVGLFGMGSRAVDRYRTDVDMVVRLGVRAPEAQWFGAGSIEPSWVYYLTRPIHQVPDSLVAAEEPQAAWQSFLAEYAVRDGDRLVAEGSAATAITRSMQLWPSGTAPLTELSRTRKFLRDDEVVVFEIRARDSVNLARVPGDSSKPH
ncbi:MAG: glycosyltransferase family 39 protein [Pirellulales bacterium]